LYCQTTEAIIHASVCFVRKQSLLEITPLVSIPYVLARTRYIAVGMLLLSTGISHAGLSLPAGLSPGDKYRIAFVTSGTIDATSSDISVYNTFVNLAANAGGALTAPLGTSWTAIASTPTVDARDNTGTNPLSIGVPVFSVDATSRIANNNADLWDGMLTQFINLDEAGVGRPNLEVWTGSQTTGVAAPSNALGDDPVQAGFTSSLNNSWIAVGPASNTVLRPLYGISAELTAVPEPGAFVCIGAIGIGILGVRLRRFIAVIRAPA
jgi:hypothetical protein